MRKIEYSKVYPGLIAFTTDYYKGPTEDIWDEIEKRFGLVPTPDLDAYIEISDEKKFVLFLLKYSDVL